MSKKVILTGVRSNEEPTIANFLGAFLPMIAMQKKYAGEYQINMFVPDLHSFTTPINHDELYQSTLHNLKYYVAAGLDVKDENTYIYRQSFVPAHSELAWILDCFTYVGEMSRMTQFKEKSAEHSASVTMGLMNYPVLMAADILLYNASYIPVGEDQFQHLEITRDIAQRMNSKFGDIFVVPENTEAQTRFIERDEGLRIRSLTDPTKKMSKSSTDEKSKILLSDSPEAAHKKIMSATTDSIGEINFDRERQPGITSLIQLYAMLSGQPQEEVATKWQGKTQYGEFKRVVADSVAAFLKDFQERYNAISNEYIESILAKNEAAVATIANETLLRAQRAVGLRPKA